MQNVNTRQTTRNYEDSPIGVAARKQDDMGLQTTERRGWTSWGNEL
jgi:hypothetical protein